MLEVAAEKDAMDIGGVGNGFVGAFHDKSVRLSVHHLQHAVGVAAYHLAVAPGYVGGKQRDDLGVGLRREETPRKLHGIGGNEFGRVDAGGFGKQKFGYFSVHTRI